MTMTCPHITCIIHCHCHHPLHWHPIPIIHHLPSLCPLLPGQPPHQWPQTQQTQPLPLCMPSVSQMKAPSVTESPDNNNGRTLLLLRCVPPSNKNMAMWIWMQIYNPVPSPNLWVTTFLIPFLLLFPSLPISFLSYFFPSLFLLYITALFQMEFMWNHSMEWIWNPLGMNIEST